MHARLALSLLLTAVLLAGVVTPLSAQQPAAPAATARPDPDDTHVAGAIFSNIVYVPGKIAKCVGSLTLWGVLMGATLGHMYEDAARIAAGGCGGKWGVDERDIKRAVESPTY